MNTNTNPNMNFAQSHKTILENWAKETMQISINNDALWAMVNDLTDDETAVLIECQEIVNQTMARFVKWPDEALAELRREYITNRQTPQQAPVLIGALERGIAA